MALEDSLLDQAKVNMIEAELQSSSLKVQSMLEFIFQLVKKVKIICLSLTYNIH